MKSKYLLNKPHFFFGLPDTTKKEEAKDLFRYL